MLFKSVTAIVLALPLLSAATQAAEEITKEKILAAAPEWRENYDKYKPPAELIDAMKAKLGPDMKIDVYLALWCPDSRKNVPLFIKILDRAGTAVPVRYFDLARKANKDIKYFVEELKVERVPTFIFYRDGKEIGRIVENPKTGMIEDFAEIVLR